MMKKSLLPIVVFVACLCSSSHLIKGDMNGDGIINVADLTGLVNIVMGVEPVCEIPRDTIVKGDTLLVTQPVLKGDMNQDDQINVADITAMVSTILEVDPKVEVPRDTIIVTPEDDGHEYVDLGLPSGTLWATCNLGAESPELPGNFYAWGETQGGKPTYTWATYKYAEGEKMLKYCAQEECGKVDNRMALEQADDAATTLWGKRWNMPLRIQWDELRDTTLCLWEWVDAYGGAEASGYLVTSKSNGKQIFFPAAGVMMDDAVESGGECGFYWTQELYDSYSPVANYIYFDKEEWLQDFIDRCNGQSIRPVRLTKPMVRIDSISVDYECDSLHKGERIQLKVKIYPENASIQTLTWTSSDTTVFKVESNGRVRAVDVGEATVTVATQDGSGLKVVCKLKALPNIVDGYEYVDLGLPSGTLWAMCNLGAKMPWEYGDFYSWGETKPKDTFLRETYKFAGDLSIYNMTKYYSADSIKLLEEEDDAAYVNMGKHWRMPSSQQRKELYDTLLTKCKWVENYKEQNVPGLLVKSLINDNELFFPASGYYTNTSAYVNEGVKAMFWTLSVNRTNYTQAYCMAIHNVRDTPFVNILFRWQGLSVRGVCMKGN